MITRRYDAPIGAGLRQFVIKEAAAAAGSSRKVTVLTANRAMEEQFKRMMPGAEFITALKWLRRASDDPADLIIVDELPQLILAAVQATLESVENEVWTIKCFMGTDAARMNSGMCAGPDLIGFQGGRYIEMDLK